MEAILRLLAALAGPNLAKWAAGVLAGLGGVFALILARRQGRADVRAENAPERGARFHITLPRRDVSVGTE